MIEAIFHLLVPFSFVGFTLYLFSCFERGGIFYFFSARLWRWKRKADRQANRLAMVVSYYWKMKERLASAILIPEGDLAYKDIKESGHLMGYLDRSTNDDGSTKELFSFSYSKPTDICFPSDIDYVTIDENLAENSLDYAGLHKYTHDKCSKLRRRAKIREYIITPIVLCPKCGLFWFSPIVFEILRRASLVDSIDFAFDWANYPLYLLVSFYIILTRK